MKQGPVRAAVMADTHGVLRPEVEQILETCDVIIHAGDFDNQMLYHKLSSRQPLYGVRGNNDRGWSGGLPGIRRFELGGVKFIMAHEITDIPSVLGDVQVVIFGHSHMFQMQEKNGRLWLNPGSCGYKRFTLPLSMAIMTIEDGAYTVETIWLEKGAHGQEGQEPKKKPGKSRYEKQQKRYRNLRPKEETDTSEKDLLFLIARILRLKKAGESNEWIAAQLEGEKEQIDRICEICDRKGTQDARKILEQWKQGAQPSEKE